MMAFTIVKIAVLAPMPSAKMRMAENEKPQLPSSRRQL